MGQKISSGAKEKGCHCRGLNGVGAVLLLLSERRTISGRLRKGEPVSNGHLEGAATLRTKGMEWPPQEPTGDKICYLSLASDSGVVLVQANKRQTSHGVKRKGQSFLGAPERWGAGLFMKKLSDHARS